MVESKCIQVDKLQNTQKDPRLNRALLHEHHDFFLASQHPTTRLNNEQWQALIALHRTLLHEHHDLFLASQHPTAHSSWRLLEAKYNMPGRMWKHRIHALLEFLRQ